MSEIRWIKLSAEMFDSAKIRLIEDMPEADTVLVIYVKLLAQAAKTNCNGFIMLNENIPLNEEMLATIFDRPLNTVRLALNILLRYEMIQITEDNRILIQDWEEHEVIDKDDKRKRETQKRVSKHREKQKLIEQGELVPPPPTKEKRVFHDGDVEMVLSKLLYERMLQNNPEAKVPNFQSWSDSIRKMIEIDKRKPEQIKNMINWSQSDPFWKTNILSARKLRDRYDQLKVRALQDYERNRSPLGNRQAQNEDVFSRVLGVSGSGNGGNGTNSQGGNVLLS